jgi:hypothetical protein
MKSTMIGYHKRIGNLEDEKYDLEYEVAKKDLEVRIFKTAVSQNFWYRGAPMGVLLILRRPPTPNLSHLAEP